MMVYNMVSIHGSVPPLREQGGWIVVFFFNQFSPFFYVFCLFVLARISSTVTAATFITNITYLEVPSKARKRALKSLD